MTHPMYRPSPHAPAAFPHLADSLRAASNHICDLWAAKVPRVLSGADEPTFAWLRLAAPQILSTLAGVIGGSPAGLGGLAAAGSGVAPIETLPGCRVEEAMVEISLLRQTIFEELPRQMGRDFDGGEVMALAEGVDAYVNQVVAGHCGQLARVAREAGENQSKYLSFLSHDLRGGLNGMFLMVEVLRRELAGKPDLAETLDDLGMMRRSILDTVATMDRFLFAERFRKGSVTARPVQMSLKALLGEVASRFAYHARDQGIEVKVTLAERADIVTDRELLLLILQGLVSNAIRATAAGTVEIAARPLQGDAGWKVEVTDPGAGIAPEKLEQILAAFGNPAPDSPGLGLGLRLASQAARAIGAKLGAESTLGTGSRFYVEITQTPHPQPDGGS